MKIKPVKGRAMLTWVGKHLDDKVEYYPAQLEEVYNVDNPNTEPTYENFKSGPNLIFQGDNKEILSTLLVNEFGGKIDLICIDPPFASGADYVRKVALRGKREKLDAEGHSVAEQIQYTDIWANDTYLQFMYERLILMYELLSNKGAIYLHCNHEKSHYLKIIMDEVFGLDSFRNEIIWTYNRFSRKSGKQFARMNDSILFYSKSDENIFHVQHTESRDSRRYEKGWHTVTDDGVTKLLVYDMEKVERAGINLSQYDKVVETEARESAMGQVWTDISILNPQSSERTDFRTQKPSALVERIITASTNEDSIVLDCFVGSGTTAVAAEKLDRRWIAADINRGAIQTTMKRIQTCIDQPRGIAHYRVNNYDASTHLERRNIVIKKCGVQIDRQEQFFDGTLEGTLVKIVDLTKPLTHLDIQHIKDELSNRPDDERNITIFCYGSESSLSDEIDEWNHLHPINKIIVREIGSEGITTFDPAQAEVNFERNRENVTITIADYISPTICDCLDRLGEHIKDFREQIDCVLIDTNYTREYFNIVESDVPKKHKNFIEGEYTVLLPRPDARVAVKIIDMLGEETIEIG